MATYSAVEQTVIRCLDALSQSLRELPAVHGSWTRAVIKCLTEPAAQHGCCGCGHNCERGEFLYDLAWLQLSPDGFIQDVPLVAESEWGNANAVEADFDKLLLTRAEHRLMIFDGTRIPDCMAFLAQLCGRIREFSRTSGGDRYLFAFWQSFPDGRDRFQFQQHVA